MIQRLGPALALLGSVGCASAALAQAPASRATVAAADPVTEPA